MEPCRDKDQYFFSEDSKLVLRSLCNKYSKVTGVFCPSLLDIPNITVFDIDNRFCSPNYICKDLIAYDGREFDGDLVIIDPPFVLREGLPLLLWVEQAQQRGADVLISASARMRDLLKSWNLKKQALLPSYEGVSNLVFQCHKGKTNTQAWWFANFNLVSKLFE